MRAFQCWDRAGQGGSLAGVPIHLPPPPSPGLSCCRPSARVTEGRLGTDIKDGCSVPALSVTSPQSSGAESSSSRGVGVASLLPRNV